MPPRELPLRPDLDQLKHQAKDLLRAIHDRDPHAIATLGAHHPEQIDPANAKLADAQLTLARKYGASSWPRLVQCCEIIDAIWRDDLDALRRVVSHNPHLLHENALVRPSNWGPPMSYAANLGRDAMIRMLHDLGARDHRSAIDRATLQGKIETARMLHELAGAPRLPNDALGGPAYTLSATGTALVFELGGRAVDDAGNRLAPVAVVLETDSRKPNEKHTILEMYVQHGVELPDTPTMAVHRGRIDLLERHLHHDPALLRRTFSIHEIYPSELGCSRDEVLATHGTPLNGATLLHMAIDYDEMEIARWLLAHGMDVDAPAAVDLDGFGGHTPLFATVVSQPNFWMNHQNRPQVAPFTELLLDHGANPNARASLRKQLHPGYGPDTMHEYRDVTPLGWGEQFHRQIFVSKPAMEMIAAAGGKL
jgi:hypothetical protein